MALLDKEHRLDELLIQQLKAEQSSSFGILYTLYFSSVAFYVKKNQGSREDAEDVFQECLMVLVQKLSQDNFVLTSSLKTYLYSISKNIWLKRLRDRKQFPANLMEQHSLIDETTLEIYPVKSLEDKIHDWLSQITDHCQWLLKAIFFYREPRDKMMEKMGWKNKHTAANQQYKCIQQLKRESLRNGIL